MCTWASHVLLCIIFQLISIISYVTLACTNSGESPSKINQNGIAWWREPLHVSKVWFQTKQILLLSINLKSLITCTRTIMDFCSFDPKYMELKWWPNPVVSSGICICWFEATDVQLLEVNIDQVLIMSSILGAREKFLLTNSSWYTMHQTYWRYN